jgi:hypothetical protein
MQIARHEIGYHLDNFKLIRAIAFIAAKGYAVDIFCSRPQLLWLFFVSI